MRTSNFVIFVTLPEDGTFYLVHGFTGAVDRVSAEVVAYLLDKRDAAGGAKTRDEEIAREQLAGRALGEVSGATIEELARRGYLTGQTPEEEQEYARKLAATLHQRNVRTKSAGFVLVPTYECNLRCPYCYAAGTRSRLTRQRVCGAVMSRETADAAFVTMDQLLARHKPDKDLAELKKGMEITLIGGEPLMEATLPVIEYIVQKGEAQGMRFSAVTNGVELDRFAHLLGPERIQWMQVTLDGPRDRHNQTRRGPLYHETYDRILDHAALALEHGVRVSARVHINCHSADRMGEIYDDLTRRGLIGHKNFSAYVDSTHSWDRGFTQPTFPDVALVALRDQLRLSARPEENGRFDASDYLIPRKLSLYLKYGLAGLCSRLEFCGATTGMYMLDAFGAIYPCWDVVGVPEHRVGSYSADGPVLNGHCEAWHSRCPATTADCDRCKYIMFHYGGCTAISVRTGQGLGGPGCYEFEDMFLAVAPRFFRSQPCETAEAAGAGQDASAGITPGLEAVPPEAAPPVADEAPVHAC